jgi:endonuclease G
MKKLFISLIILLSVLVSLIFISSNNQVTALSENSVSLDTTKSKELVNYTNFKFINQLQNNTIIDSSGVDTIIDAHNYKSYYDWDIKQPIYVKYILYKGGGECDRSNFRFKNDTKIKMATTKDYAGSGFDMGHLANAEDFAYDCFSGERTFRFYNCLPQYPNLNRGVWKRWENKVREWSQTDSLLVVCGGKFSDKKIGNGVYVPEYCWKVVYSIRSNHILKVLWFKNVEKDAEKNFEEISIYKLRENLGYNIILSY